MEGETSTGPIDRVELVDVPEAAKLMSVSESTVRRLCYRGELDSIKVGTRLLVPVVAIAEYIKAHLNGKSPEVA